MGERLDGLVLRTASWWNSRRPIPATSMGSNRALVLAAGVRVAERYRLVRVLGEGGMGRVWLADDLQERRQVALKEMRLDPDQTAAQLEESALQFRREFFAMKKLQHPNTVKVFESGQLETGDRFLTMEVVPGMELTELLQRGPIDSKHVASVLIQLSQALSFIHSRLFVHCDLKAENVRQTPQGVIKLMDFGLMHQLGTPAGGVLKGTPHYMAPEWPRGGGIDARTDLYSVGVLGYLLLTGRFPFEGRTVAEILDGHLKRSAPAPSNFAKVDPKLEAVIVRLLQKAPADRYPDAGTLAEALSEASGIPLAVEPIAARASYLQVSELVGRDQDMALLHRSLEEAQGGRAKALLLGAPPGIGKTRLLQEFELRAKLQEIPFVVGICRAEGLAPLAPLRQALLALIPITPTALLQEHRPLLSKLLPSLGTEGSPVFKNPSDERAAVFKALSGWLRGLASVRPVVIVLEDLHWADNSTLEHLNVIIRALRNTRGLVLGSFRSNEMDRLSVAFQTVDEGESEKCELAPLSEQHVGTLIGLALRGFEVPSDFVKRLHEATSGNAFFVTEILRGLVEQGVLTRKAARWEARSDFASSPLPPKLEMAVRGRLDSLPAEQLRFYQRLAPVGRVVEMGLARDIAELNEDAFFAALDEGVERQFLQYSEGRYFFVHDLLRAAIYDATPEEARRQHHARIGEYLEKTYAKDPEQARSVGYHFTRSNEPKRAIRHLMTAGDQALANKALVEATMVMREASQLLEKYPEYTDSAVLRTGLWGKLIEVGFNGHPPSCVEFSIKLFQQWEKAGLLLKGEEEYRSSLQKAGAANDKSRSKILGTIYREIPVREPMPSLEAFIKQAELRVLLAVALAAMGKNDDLGQLIRSVEREQPPGSPFRAPSVLGRAVRDLHLGKFGLVKELRVEIDAQRAVRAEMGSLTRRQTWTLGMLDFFNNLYRVQIGVGLDTECSDEGFKIADEFGFGDIRIHHLNAKLTHACFQGSGPYFSEAYGNASDQMRKLGNPRLLESRAFIFIPMYYIERGELELAQAAVARQQRLAELMPMDRWLPLYAQSYAACLDVLTGKHEQAQKKLAAVIQTARASDFRLLSYLLTFQSRNAAAQGQTALAREAANEALVRSSESASANPFDECFARRALAELCAVDEGMEQLNRALKFTQQAQNRLQEGIVRLQMAQLLAQRNRRAAAEHGQEAENCFKEVQAPQHMRRLDEFRDRASRMLSATG